MNIYIEMINTTPFPNYGSFNAGKKRKDKNRSKYKPHYGKQAAERNFKRMNKVA